MSNLTLQRRLAAECMNCGVHAVWIHPEHLADIAKADARETVRSLIKGGLISRRATDAKSRFGTRQHAEAVALGRHSGLGKRKGTRNARCPTKALWIRRQRVLRNLLVNYRDANKIDSHIYRRLYKLSKGNQFKNKAVLIDYIHKEKADLARKVAADKALATRKEKAAAIKTRRLARIATKYETIAAGKL